MGAFDGFARELFRRQEEQGAQVGAAEGARDRESIAHRNAIEDLAPWTDALELVRHWHCGPKRASHVNTYPVGSVRCTFCKHPATSKRAIELDVEFGEPAAERLGHDQPAP